MSRRHSQRVTVGTRRRTSPAECSCGKPTRDGAYVCETCLDEMTRDLRDLIPTSADNPGLWGELRSALAGERGIDYRALGGASGGSDATGLVIDELAVGRGRRAQKLLRSTVRACMAVGVEHKAPTGWTPQSVDSVPAMAEWLLWRVTGMAWHPEFAALPKDLGRAVDAIRTTVMPPPHRQWLGSCSLPLCRGSMFARRDETFATCNVCGSWVEAKALRDWLVSEIEDQLCTASEIADLYDPDPSVRDRVRKRVNQWARRGRLLDPRVMPWHADAVLCPRPNPALVFRFGDAFDLLVAEDHAHQHDSTTNQHTNESTEEPR